MHLKSLKNLNKSQILIIVTGLILLIWFSPFVSFVFNVGSVLGLIFSLLLIFVGLFLKKIEVAAKKLFKKCFGKILIIAGSIILTASILFTLTVTGFMFSKAANSPPENTNAVVLGCSLNGSTPSRMLKKRLDAALIYLSANKDAVCILSGGQGDGEDITEAAGMLTYLTGKGIDKNRLILEDKSTSTNENIEFSKELIIKNNLGSDIAFITSNFHQFRTSLIAKKYGITAYAVDSKTGFFSMPTFFVREILAIAKELI